VIAADAMLQASSWKRSLAIALVSVVVAACTKFAVRTDRKPDADFTRYRTFAWMTIAASPPNDQDTGSRGLDKRIYSAVEVALQRAGYVPASSGDADLLLTFRILKEDGYDDEHIPYAAQWRRGAYLEAMHASPDSYERGTLIIDAVDRAENTLAWRGSASARLLPHMSYDKRAERAEDAVAQIMATFPARAK
jgi:hypothetical protein